MLSCEDVKKLIENNIDGASAEVRDLTGTSDHFGVRVVSGAFAGKTLLQQHKMVHAAVGDHLTREIHALEIETLAE